MDDPTHNTVVITPLSRYLKQAKPQSETTENPSATRPTRGDFIRLRDLLSGIPTDEIAMIIKGYEQGIRDGVISSVPLAGERFKIGFRDMTGRRVRRTIDDEYIARSDKFDAWVETQRRETRYRSMTRSGHVQTSLERLEAGIDDFERMAELRRTSLKPKSPGKRK